MSFDVPIQRYEDGLMVVDVRLGGRLLPFLFDTGLGVTAVVPQVAAALSREPYAGWCCSTSSSSAWTLACSTTSS